MCGELELRVQEIQRLELLIRRCHLGHARLITASHPILVHLHTGPLLLSSSKTHSLLGPREHYRSSRLLTCAFCLLLRASIGFW